ncbi:26S proteasome regulatory subunit 8, partial [Peltigera leucophlebia]|nr:26S proteasome regulatory subunit 8 [Peltigera leucophlebia]
EIHSGSDLVQKYIGEENGMVRELFVIAREHAPNIKFMDEIDSIGSSRVEWSSGGDSEVQRTMLELLNQLDGFERIISRLSWPKTALTFSTQLYFVRGE